MLGGSHKNGVLSSPHQSQGLPKGHAANRNADRIQDQLTPGQGQTAHNLGIKKVDADHHRHFPAGVLHDRREFAGLKVAPFAHGQGREALFVDDVLPGTLKRKHPARDHLAVLLYILGACGQQRVPGEGSGNFAYQGQVPVKGHNLRAQPVFRQQDYIGLLPFYQVENPP